MNILRTGVFIAVLLIGIGGIISLFFQVQQPFDYHLFKAEAWGFENITSIVHDSFQGDGIGLIKLGTLILILTPVTRVLACVGIFLYQHDWLYVCISMIVLGILIYTIFL